MESFNTVYQMQVADYRDRIKLLKIGNLTFCKGDESYIRAGIAPEYVIPPEIIQFINRSGHPEICKLHAESIHFGIEKLQNWHMYSICQIDDEILPDRDDTRECSYCQDTAYPVLINGKFMCDACAASTSPEVQKTWKTHMNVLDLVEFASNCYEKFYVNCNTASPNYGNIAVGMYREDYGDVIKTLYKDFREMLSDVREWIVSIPDIPDFQENICEREAKFLEGMGRCSNMSPVIAKKFSTHAKILVNLHIKFSNCMSPEDIEESVGYDIENMKQLRRQYTSGIKLRGAIITGDTSDEEITNLAIQNIHNWIDNNVFHSYLVITLIAELLSTHMYDDGTYRAFWYPYKN